MGPKTNSRNSDYAHVYAVIMAGGSGTRFWPLSRRKHPKQLLDIFGHSTLLEQTVARLEGLVPHERIYIFTNELVHGEILQRLPRIPARQIVAEPAQRNTAPTIGLAAHEILRRDPEGVMAILPADHVIKKPAAFRSALKAGCRWAATECRSVVLGIEPTRPETGYGYVRLGELAKRIGGQRILRVEKFTEKPKLPVARRYVASKRYLWNAGMFIWRASTLIQNLQRVQPKMARELEQIAAAGGIDNGRALKKLFPRFEKISIDYALMEKLSGVFAVAADIGWSDVGSWAVAYELSQKDEEGNVRPNNSLSIGSAGNMLVSDREFLVTIGVKDLIIVETGDALLVCARERSQDVGKAVRELERLKLNKLL
ncbi:MAG: mannose-1-phosphate guanylyltransferase [Acidobacteria bacterium]|nr:mannose-1-phosphate guanylyltransferase [Acidobacteriota bacterium]